MTLCRSCSGSKLFANVISRREKSLNTFSQQWSDIVKVLVFVLFKLLLLKLKSYESAVNYIFGGSFVLAHF